MMNVIDGVLGTSLCDGRSRVTPVRPVPWTIGPVSAGRRGSRGEHRGCHGRPDSSGLTGPGGTSRRRSTCRSAVPGF